VHAPEGVHGATWCCEKLKEHKHPDRIVLTGIRWSESTRRAARRMVETNTRCRTQRFLHPLLDWRVADVWGCLRTHGVETCSLYAEGYRRIGCVCCPLGTHGHAEALRWPHIAGAMRRAFWRYCDAHPGRIEDRERMWDRFLAGELGRRGRKPQGCPLFADARDGEEASPPPHRALRASTITEAAGAAGE